MHKINIKNSTMCTKLTSGLFKKIFIILISLNNIFLMLG